MCVATPSAGDSLHLNNINDKHFKCAGNFPHEKQRKEMSSISLLQISKLPGTFSIYKIPSCFCNFVFFIGWIKGFYYYSVN